MRYQNSSISKCVGSSIGWRKYLNSDEITICINCSSACFNVRLFIVKNSPNAQLKCANTQEYAVSTWKCDTANNQPYSTNQRPHLDPKLPCRTTAPEKINNYRPVHLNRRMNLEMNTISCRKTLGSKRPSCFTADSFAVHDDLPIKPALPLLHVQAPFGVV